jgi:hypothetical protein
MSGTGITYGTLFAGATTLIAVVAANGEGFANALKAFPEVVSAYASGMPFGVGSSLIAVVASVVVWLNVRMRVPVKASGTDGQSFKADYLAYIAGIAVAVIQTLLAGRTDTYGLLSAAMSGAMASAVAVLLARGAAALYFTSNRST